MLKTILLLRDVTVYRVKPPYPVKGGRFKSAVWSNRDKLWSGTLRLCLGRSFREVRLEEQDSGALFAKVYVPSHSFDYSVLDSNEHFVLKFRDGDQSTMHLGLSFSESSDALKFYRALLCQEEEEEEEEMDVDDSSEEVHVDVNDSGKTGKDLALLFGVAGDAGEREDDVREDEEEDDDVSEDEEEDDDLGEGTSGPRTEDEEDEMNVDASFKEVHIDVDNSGSLRKMGKNMPYGNVSEARKFIDHYDKIEVENVRLHDELAKLETVNSRNLELLNKKDDQLKTLETVKSRNLELLNKKDDQLKTLEAKLKVVEGDKNELQQQKSLLLQERAVYNNRIEDLEKNQRDLHRLLIAISEAVGKLQGEQENYIQSTLNSVQEQGNNIRSKFENLINNINGRIANWEAEMSAS